MENDNTNKAKNLNKSREKSYMIDDYSSQAQADH